MIYYIICAIAGYLIGSIPFGYIIVKLKKGIDIRTVGSGNIGATNVGRILGWPWGILCFLLDAAKGFLPTFLVIIDRSSIVYKDSICLPEGLCLFLDETPGIPIGLSLIIGHLFPGYLRFRGGKGVATALGVFFAIVPGATLIALIGWIVFFLILRYVSFASIIAAILLPLSIYYLFVYLYGNDEPYSPAGMATRYELGINLIFSSIISLLVIIKHIPNIKRLVKGTEPKVKLWGKGSK